MGATQGGSVSGKSASNRGLSEIALPDDRLDDLIHDALNEVEWDENEPYRLSDREFADGVLAALRELKERRANG